MSGKNDSNSVNILEVFPDNYDINVDLEYIQLLSFPSKIDNNYSGVHIYNTPNIYGHSWSFLFNNIPYSITIITSCFRPYLFTSFLKEVKEQFDSNTNIDPICKYGYIKSLLSSWVFSDASVLTVTFPSGVFDIDIIKTKNWTENYDISPISSLIDNVWRCLLSNAGIIIIGANAEIASSSLLAIISIIEPLKYMDPMLIYTKSGDLRYENILQGTTEYKLVSTTEDFYPHRNQFALSIRIPEGHFPKCSDIQETYQQKTQRYFSSLLSVLNQSILVDPYFDILSKPIGNLDHYASQSSLYEEPFLEKVQSTQTFIKWRSRKKFREQLRGAFLSVPPEQAVNRIPPEKMQYVYEELIRWLNTNEGDFHLQTVIKQHIKIISKRIMNNKSS